MNKKDVVYIHNGLYTLGYGDLWESKTMAFVLTWKGSGESKLDGERQTLHHFTHREKMNG